MQNGGWALLLCALVLEAELNKLKYNWEKWILVVALDGNLHFFSAVCQNTSYVF